MLAKKTSKNQITIPKKIAESFPDVEYFDIRVEGDKILLAPAKILPAGPTLEGVREKMKQLGITGNDVSEAVRWARRQRK
jgi:bifunctional DNA-binding transcriptional regulator/antitoxin component of YhaV-PrlF toxin-antitoxin module